MKIVLGSSNEHKVKEINEIVKGSGIEFILPSSGFDPVEDGSTFEENSLIKARAAWELSKTWALADDSGLCIDALGGKPGIYSARYAETPAKRIERVLKERIKLIDEASLKYFVGQEISPILNLLYKISASIWLSKIKSSLQSSSGRVSNIFLVNPLNPVWYSESFSPVKKFSNSVKNLFAIYL